MQHYGLSSDHYQTLYTIALLPWTFKPLFACGCDSVRNKSSILAGAAAIGAVACGVLISMPPISTVIWMYVLASSGAMMIDSTLEGKYSQAIKLSGGSPTLTPFVWGMVSLGSIAAACVVGPFADSGLFTAIFGSATVCFAQLLIPTLLVKGSVPPDKTVVVPARSEWQTALAISGCGLLCGILVANTTALNAFLGSVWAVSIAAYIILSWYGGSALTRGMLFVFLFEFFNVQVTVHAFFAADGS